MKTLLLTQVLPYPPDSGPKVKTWNVIKYLARRHEVTLVSFVRGDQSAEVRELARYAVRQGAPPAACASLAAQLTRRPISSAVLAEPLMSTF